MKIKNILYISLIVIQAINAADYTEKLKRLEIAEANLRIAQEKEKAAEENYRKIVEKNQREKLQREEEEEEEEAKQRALEKQNKIALQLTHQTFFTPLKEYQWEQLKTALSTVSDNSITTLYQNAGRSGALIIPQEVLKDHQNDLPEVLSQYNLTLSEWTKSNWNDALDELSNQHSFSGKLLCPIQLQQVPQLIDYAKTISKAFLPPHKISPIDQEQHFFTKKYCTERRIFTYIKLKQIIESKKLSHIRLPIKFLVIRNEQTNEYITDKQSIAPLIDKHMTIELDYADPVYGTLMCTGPLFLDPEDTYDTTILAEKITNSEKTLNDNAFDELKQLVQDAPFDIGYANIFTDENGDAIIIDTEFKGEPASTCLPKLNRYR